MFRATRCAWYLTHPHRRTYRCRLVQRGTAHFYVLEKPRRQLTIVPRLIRYVSSQREMCHLFFSGLINFSSNEWTYCPLPYHNLHSSMGKKNDERHIDWYLGFVDGIEFRYHEKKAILTAISIVARWVFHALTWIYHEAVQRFNLLRLKVMYHQNKTVTNVRTPKFSRAHPKSLLLSICTMGLVQETSWWQDFIPKFERLRTEWPINRTISSPCRRQLSRPCFVQGLARTKRDGCHLVKVKTTAYKSWSLG